MSIFMKIEGIKGAASDKNYRDWLDIDHFKWDSQRKITSTSSTQGDRESIAVILYDALSKKTRPDMMKHFFAAS